jgi:hypothetical protein
MSGSNVGRAEQAPDVLAQRKRKIVLGGMCGDWTIKAVRCEHEIAEMLYYG